MGRLTPSAKQPILSELPTTSVADLMLSPQAADSRSAQTVSVDDSTPKFTRVADLLVPKDSDLNPNSGSVGNSQSQPSVSVPPSLLNGQPITSYLEIDRSVASPERRPGYVEGSILRAIRARQTKTTTEPAGEILTGLAQPVGVSPNTATLAPEPKAPAPTLGSSQVIPSTTLIPSIPATVPGASPTSQIAPVQPVISTSAKDLRPPPDTLAPALNAPASVQSNSKPPSGSPSIEYGGNVEAQERLNTTNGSSETRVVAFGTAKIPFEGGFFTIKAGGRIRVVGKDTIIEPELGGKLELATAAGKFTVDGSVRFNTKTGAISLIGGASLTTPDNVTVSGDYIYNATTNTFNELGSTVKFGIGKDTNGIVRIFSVKSGAFTATELQIGVEQKNIFGTKVSATLMATTNLTTGKPGLEGAITIPFGKSYAKLSGDTAFDNGVASQLRLTLGTSW